MFIFEQTALTMKKIFLSLFLTLFLISHSQNLIEKSDPQKQHIAYGELTTWLLWNVATVNYEAGLITKNKFTLNPRIGVGGYFTFNGIGTTVPLSLNGVFGKEDLKFELNLGAHFFYEEDGYSTAVNSYPYSGEKPRLIDPLQVFPIARFGLRYHYERLIFKANIGIHGLGGAIGYRINK